MPYKGPLIPYQGWGAFFTYAMHWHVLFLIAAQPRHTVLRCTFRGWSVRELARLSMWKDRAGSLPRFQRFRALGLALTGQNHVQELQTMWHTVNTLHFHFLVSTRSIFVCISCCIRRGFSFVFPFPISFTYAFSVAIVIGFVFTLAILFAFLFLLQGHHQLSGKVDENKSFNQTNQRLLSILW